MRRPGNLPSQELKGIRQPGNARCACLVRPPDGFEGAEGLLPLKEAVP